VSYLKDFTVFIGCSLYYAKNFTCLTAFAIWLVSFLVYEYFIFSPAGIATENKNVVRIAIVTAILVIETIVLIVKEMNKRKKTA